MARPQCDTSVVCLLVLSPPLFQQLMMGFDSLPFLGAFFLYKVWHIWRRGREKRQMPQLVFLNKSLFNKGLLYLSFVNGGLYFTTPLYYSANSGLWVQGLGFSKWGLGFSCSFCNGFAKKKLKLGRLPQNSSFYVRMECLPFGSAIYGRRGKL